MKSKNRKKKKSFPSIYLFIHPIISWGANYERLSNGKVPTLKSLGSEHTLRPSLKGANILFLIYLFFFLKILKHTRPLLTYLPLGFTPPLVLAVKTISPAILQ